MYEWGILGLINTGGGTGEEEWEESMPKPRFMENPHRDLNSIN